MTNRNARSNNNTATELFTAVVYQLMRGGHKHDSRAGMTLELLDYTAVLTNPKACLPPINRKANLSIGIAEALQLIAGVSDPGLMMKITPNFKQYADGGSFWGPYGVRTAGQMPAVIERLQQSHGTRQAIVALWDPRYDLVPNRRDYPCTLSFTFRIRDGALELKTHMRSNDAWLGLPYDIMQFTQLQCTVANVLDIAPGLYTHHVDSMHIYERDWKSAEKFLEERAGQEPEDDLAGIHGSTWMEVATRSLNILHGHGTGHLTTTEEFMLDKMVRYSDAGEL